MRVDRRERDVGRLRIGCVNTQGWGVGKWEMIEKEMVDHEIEILAVTETQCREEAVVERQEFRAVMKGRSKMERKGGGVGIIVKRGRGWDLENIEVKGEKETEDVMGVRMERQGEGGRETIIIVVVYLTVEGRGGGQGENERKLAAVSRIISQARGEEVMVLGDFNAHIGILGEKVNKNGELLLDFMEGAELINLNLEMGIERATWEKGGKKSTIDYALVNRRARGKVRGLEIDEEGEIDVGSDHKMVLVEYGGSARDRPKNEVEKERWDIGRADWERYRNGLDSGDRIGEGGIEELNTNLTERLVNSAKQAVGKKKPKIGRKGGKGLKKWWNRDLKDAYNKKKEVTRERRVLEVKKKRGEVVGREQVEDVIQRQFKEMVGKGSCRGGGEEEGAKFEGERGGRGEGVV